VQNGIGNLRKKKELVSFQKIDYRERTLQGGLCSLREMYEKLRGVVSFRVIRHIFFRDDSRENDSISFSNIFSTLSMKKI